VAEPVGLGFLLEVRAGIGHRHEAASRLVPEGLLRLVEEEGLEDVRLQGRARLAGDDEEGLLDVDLVRQRLELGRVGGVEDEQLRRARHLAERLLPHLRTEAGASHAQEDRLAEALLLGLRLDRQQGVEMVELGFDDADPANPASLVAARPERSVALPEPAGASLFVPLLQAGRDLGGQGRGKGVRLGIDAGLVRFAAAPLDRLQELREGLDELLQPVGQEVVRDLGQGNPGFLELVEDLHGVGHFGFQAGPGPAVVAERVQGLGRHRVHGLGADQLLDVDHVAVVRVLGAGAGPEYALGLGALGEERVPARAGEDLLVALVGHLGVGDRHLAHEALEPGLVGAGRGLCLFRQDGVHRRVDPAHEEAGHAGHVREGIALRRPRLQPFDERHRHRLVGRFREQQGDVDVDPVGDQGLDGGEAGGSRRDLDHHVGPRHPLPEVPRFLEGPFGVVGQIGGHLQAHVAVALLGGLVDTLQHVGRVLDVLHRQALVDLLGGEAGLVVRDLLDRGGVVVAAVDGLLEDGRVRGHASQGVVVEQALQFAPGDQAPADEVEPDRLAVLTGEGGQGAGHRRRTRRSAAHDPFSCK
jgi:hypothetical protein